MPSTNCHGLASRPIQPGAAGRPSAATLPGSSGAPSASEAVMPLSRRWPQAARKSGSMQAMKTSRITAHQATPLGDWITAGLKTKRSSSGKAAPSTPGPSAMPARICTTTRGAK